MVSFELLIGRNDSLMEDVDTLTTIWFPPKEYDLSERPENGYYIYENVAFVVKAGAVDGLSIVSPKYSFNGLMVGDSSEMILSTMESQRGNGSSMSLYIMNMTWEHISLLLKLKREPV